MCNFSVFEYFYKFCRERICYVCSFIVCCLFIFVLLVCPFLIHLLSLITLLSMILTLLNLLIFLYVLLILPHVGFIESLSSPLFLILMWFCGVDFSAFTFFVPLLILNLYNFSLFKYLFYIWRAWFCNVLWFICVWLVIISDFFCFCDEVLLLFIISVQTLPLLLLVPYLLFLILLLSRIFHPSAFYYFALNFLVYFLLLVCFLG